MCEGANVGVCQTISHKYISNAAVCELSSRNGVQFSSVQSMCCKQTIIHKYNYQARWIMRLTGSENKMKPMTTYNNNILYV